MPHNNENNYLLKGSEMKKKKKTLFAKEIKGCS